MLKKYNWIAEEITKFPPPGVRDEIDLLTLRETILETANTPRQLSPAAEFFLASMLVQSSPSPRLSLPVPDPKVMKRIIEEIAPFFQTAKSIYCNHSPLPFELTLEHPKEEVVQAVHKMRLEEAMNPVIASLYKPGMIAAQRADSEFLHRSHLRVAKKHIEPYPNPEFDQVLAFLKECFLSQDHQIVLVPHNWSYHENLHREKALQYFSAFFDHVLLSVVDETAEVTFLTVY